MRTIYEHGVGPDAIAGLYVDGDFLIEQVKYPLQKALDAPEVFIDAQITNLETKFPVAQGLLETARAAYKAALAKLIGG